MKTKPNLNRSGLTAVELVISGVIGVIVMLGVSGVLANNQKRWNTMYNHTYSNVMTSGYVAKAGFDGVIRKASTQGVQIDPDGAWVEVNYYLNDDSTAIDRYARFFYEEEEKKLQCEYGRLNPKEALGINTICRNVTNCLFKQSGNCVHMIMTIRNGNESQTIGTSAQLHN